MLNTHSTTELQHQFFHVQCFTPFKKIFVPQYKQNTRVLSLALFVTFIYFVYVVYVHVGLQHVCKDQGDNCGS